MKKVCINLRSLCGTGTAPQSKDNHSGAWAKDHLTLLEHTSPLDSPVTVNAKLNFSPQAGPVNWLWKGNEDPGGLLRPHRWNAVSTGTELQPNQRPVVRRCPTAPDAGSFSPFAVLAHCRNSVGICYVLEKLWESLIQMNITTKANVFAFPHMF